MRKQVRLHGAFPYCVLACRILLHNYAAHVLHIPSHRLCYTGKVIRCMNMDNETPESAPRATMASTVTKMQLGSNTCLFAAGASPGQGLATSDLNLIFKGLKRGSSG